MKPYTEQAMQIERAPWLPEDFMDMDDLYTQLTLEQLCNKPKGPKGIKIDDYKDLFDDKSFLKAQAVSDGKSQKDEGSAATKMCTKPSKKKNKKVLLKGKPGFGKTTLAKKMALDWARGVFTTFSIVLFVILKLVNPGDAIENVIIKQNFWLEGLGVTQCKLEAILNAFGGKCLLILDGLDEHALGKNEDVLKIIRGQKLLNCNIVLTSRPHSITVFKKYFDVIAVVEGFAKKQARQFASKILSDENQIDAVMGFDPYRKNDFDYFSDIIDFYDYSHDSHDDGSGHNADDNDSYSSHENVTLSKRVYNCPILLSFLCILVQDHQIDLSTPTLSFGEIYSRMIRCLYMKYLRRQGLEFCLNEFIKLTKTLGKLAFESLLTGNVLFRKSQILNVAGPSAFDYGLLIGHEDAHRLIRDETADIFVTFAHRSIQEFLGAFFFVLSLNEGQSMESLLGADCTNPIFMVTVIHCSSISVPGLYLVRKEFSNSKF